MKTFFRLLSINLLIMYLFPQFIPGFNITGTTITYFIGAIALVILLMVLKPVLTFFTFPLHFLTLGLFTICIHSLLFYLLTVLVPEVQIQPFTYNSLDLGIIIIPNLSFNTLFAYVFVGFCYTCIEGWIKWITK